MVTLKFSKLLTHETSPSFSHFKLKYESSSNLMKFGTVNDKMPYC